MAGGTVKSSDGSVTVTVPPGAVTANVAVTLRPASSVPPGAIGTAYEIGPEGTTFAWPVTITIAYDASKLGGTAPDMVTLSSLQNGAWVAQPGSLVDPGAHVVATLTTHLSVWAVTPGDIPAGSCTCAGNPGAESAWASCCQKLGGAFGTDGSACCCVGPNLDAFVQCYTPLIGGGLVANFCDDTWLRTCCVTNGEKVNDVCDCVGDQGSWGPVVQCALPTFAPGTVPKWLACAAEEPQGGSCVAPLGCLPVGATCSGDCGGGCCSWTCINGTCQAAAECQPSGAACSTTADCCGGSAGQAACNSGVCKFTSGCIPTGGICKLATNSCNAGCECCSGNCETQSTCQPDVNGVPRCQ